tara:strand:+ start:266 stop:874 length:609 start_codon:yes stop_codon:yes gene_type:complete
MIYTLGTHEVSEAETRASARARKAGWGAGPGTPLALFSVVLGGRYRLLELSLFDSLQHWQDDALTGNPATGVSESIALSPLTRRRPLETIDADDGIYTMRTFGVARENVRRFVEVSEDGWWPWVLQVQGVRPLGQWLSISAAETRVYMMARYDDMAHWEDTRQVGPRPEDASLVSLWETASACISERSSLMLDTNMVFMQLV